MLLHDENVELEKTVKAGGELPPICPRNHAREGHFSIAVLTMVLTAVDKTRYT